MATEAAVSPDEPFAGHQVLFLRRHLLELLFGFDAGETGTKEFPDNRIECGAVVQANMRGVFIRRLAFDGLELAQGARDVLAGAQRLDQADLRERGLQLGGADLPDDPGACGCIDSSERSRALGYSRNAANRTGRVFAITYDMTGMRSEGLYERMTTDWKWLVDEMKITADPRYLHENLALFRSS